ncbi:uncharacterized protein [Montipora capricornis]|uniref:uncharacterized protein isoform X1 n=1 Tax=Montipora capricornis TaxID=246305 RepID=UPI0035F155A3
MQKVSTWTITKILLFNHVLNIVTTVLMASRYETELKASYFMISSQITEGFEFTEVGNALGEKDCLSLCNRDVECTDFIDSASSGSICLMKLKQKGMTHEKLVKRVKEHNFVHFRKLGRNFDFKSRTFGFGDEDEEVTRPRSCKEIYDTNSLASDGNYPIWPNGADGQEVNVYCHMTKIPGCDEGGWTLVMKIDGNKPTFMYSSKKWTRKQAYHPSSALNGLDMTEMVSPAYWTTPLSKLCLGMRKNSEMNWIMVPLPPRQSLHRIINGKKVIHTHLGQNEWKSLLSNSYLQGGCEREGINVFINDQKVRIGMVAGRSCIQRDASVIGFGTTTSVVCGNYYPSLVGGSTTSRSFGYILVQ